MNYEQFITELQKYWDLRSKGLKKQANTFLLKFPGKNLPRRHLPYQVTDLLNSYLIRFIRTLLKKKLWNANAISSHIAPDPPCRQLP